MKKQNKPGDSKAKPRKRQVKGRYCQDSFVKPGEVLRFAEQLKEEGLWPKKIGKKTLIQNKRKYQHRQQLSDMQAYYEKTLFQTELKILEDTFSAISQNLHDNIGSNISTAILLLYKDENMSASEQEVNRKEALSILDKIVDDLKYLARSLNPDYLYKIGLSEAIQQRIEQLAKTKKYELKLSLNESPRQLDKK